MKRFIIINIGLFILGLLCTPYAMECAAISRLGDTSAHGMEVMLCVLFPLLYIILHEVIGDLKEIFR